MCGWEISEGVFVCTYGAVVHLLYSVSLGGGGKGDRVATKIHRPDINLSQVIAAMRWRGR